MQDEATNKYPLPDIVKNFAMEGEAAQISLHGSGHIHDTFQVKNANPASPDYLLQRMNHQIFKNVPALMQNVEKVIAHLKQKIKAAGGNPETEVLTLIPTKTNASYFKDTDGNFWRMYLFLPNTRSYDLVETPQQAYEGGKAFGKFQALLSDINPNQLHETIPAFHDVDSRQRQLKEARQHNHQNRLQHVTAEIAFVESRAKNMRSVLEMGRTGQIPLRVTHNDTKFNNVLLDQQDHAQCVIDLDTVMPGYVAYDFGDALRTIVNTAPEDEKELGKINVRVDLFEGFSRGFLQETSSFLTEQELHSLVTGVLLLPYLIGLRFLTDYLNGDVYFKTHYPEHNLVRARAQFRLVEQLEAIRPQLEDLLESLYQKAQTAL